MTETIEWIDPDGVSFTLNVDWAVAGRFMPKIEFQTEGAPGVSGEFLREVRHGPTEFTMPFDILGTSESDLRSNLREIIASLDPRRGDGTLRVTSPVGDVREIACHLASGGELNETLGQQSGFDWQRINATFVAFDPYWRDTSPISVPFEVTETPNFFPILPINLVSSEIVVHDVISNTGDVEAWPIWTITGPGSVIKLTNSTTGKFLSIPTGSLSSGQTLTIDTTPGVKSVLYGDGTSAYNALTIDSSLWPIIRGTNNIVLEMSGVDATTSSLDLTYHRRYLSP